jgi:hypothetical protein
MIDEAVKLITELKLEKRSDKMIERSQRNEQ